MDVSSIFPSFIQEREVYYFVSDRISSDIPHYFICIKKTPNEVLIFTCCTTQFEKREKYIIQKGYSMRTLVYINPTDSGTSLTENTLVDCNQYFTYTLEDFTKLFNEGKVSLKGTLDEVYYEKLIIGLHESSVIEAELKSQLPPHPEK